MKRDLAIFSLMFTALFVAAVAGIMFSPSDTFAFAAAASGSVACGGMLAFFFARES